MSDKVKRNQSTFARRDWLKNAALFGAAAVTSPSLMAGTDPVGNPLINHSMLANKNAIRLIVSTYSYWHFGSKKYPIEKVIEKAAEIGFDGVEILQRQMESVDIPYMNKLKRLAFDNGLALPFLSIHQNFIEPDERKRVFQIDHTLACIRQAVQMGIPAIRLNTGSWPGKRPDNYYQTGKMNPLPGYTDRDAFNWVVDAMGECLKHAEREGIILCIENHWGLSSNIDLLLEIYNALKSSPSMGLNVDTGNYVGEPYTDFRRLVKHANIVQAKTYYGGGHYYDKELDYDRLAKIMREENFTGYVSLEMEGKENADTAVPKSYKMLRKSLSI
ncbi:hypothetical protein KCTC52924_00858 [Arenibacter antarcticus]|uniref:Sugar phosphate isomerase/epimerase family protein n=1 Tax=Arenibacter antarcticus TaxID=2040469 RepID=A0ABW5VAB3_9FLAO|nr:sugar phosphate isomerase/epimerase family protein [Arenibacter sp. H213]MCM4167634.1 xylose isomerase [Arenibacter sp. H213]